MPVEPTNDTELSPEERIVLPPVMATQNIPDLTKWAGKFRKLQAGLDRGEISDTDLGEADLTKAPQVGFRPYGSISCTIHKSFPGTLSRGLHECALLDV